MKTIYDNSLGFKGLQLLNALAKHLGDFHRVGVDVFKMHFDPLLSEVPDEPESRQEIQKMAAVLNSLHHQNQPHEIGH